MNNARTISSFSSHVVQIMDRLSLSFDLEYHVKIAFTQQFCECFKGQELDGCWDDMVMLWHIVTLRAAVTTANDDNTHSWHLADASWHHLYHTPLPNIIDVSYKQFGSYSMQRFIFDNKICPFCWSEYQNLACPNISESLRYTCLVYWGELPLNHIM